MDLTKNFLQQDVHKAFEEYVCATNCAFIQNQAIEEGDYKTALRMAENVTRSLRELDRLKEKKKAEDELRHHSIILITQQLGG